MEAEVVIHRYLFTFKHPVNLGPATLPLLKSAESMINAGYGKVKRVSKREDLPAPVKTTAPGLALIEFYMEKGVLQELDLNLFKEIRAYTRKFRLPSIDANKLDLLKALGVEWRFEELEEFKGV